MRKLVAISFFILSAFASALVATKATSRVPASIGYSRAETPRAAANEPTFETLVATIYQNETKTIGDLLSIFAKKYPGYLAGHTLAYQSLSLHGSSPENPRAIVFGQSANLVLTFNGAPEQKSYSNLEIMSFTPEKGFQFREIHFNKEPNAETSVPAKDIEIRGSVATISKPNPEFCMQCHGQKIARPIWQPYFLWPGMYGSDDDGLYRHLFPKDPFFDASLARVGKVSRVDQEAENYKKFLRNKKTNARYRTLPDAPYIPSRSDVPAIDEDDRNISHYRANLSLLLAFSEQTQVLMFQDIMKKNPSTDFLIRATRILCVADADQLKIAKDYAKAPFVQAYLRQVKELTTEDLGRLYDNYQGHATLDSQDEKPVSRQEFINAAIANQAATEIVQQSTGPSLSADIQGILFLEMLKKIGLNPVDYAINLRRYPVFTTGLAPFGHVREKFLGLLKTRAPSVQIKCAKLNGY